MRVTRTPFIFLLLVGLSWVSLWTVRLPRVVVDRIASLPPRSRSSSSTSSSLGHRAALLRTTNLGIVRNATLIDLTYVDVSNNHEDDPHRGGRDENGNFGYVLNETISDSHPHALLDRPTLRQDCLIRDSHHALLTRRVFIDKEAHDAVDRSGMKRARILCIVYSTDANRNKIPAIRETWGQKCDGFMVGSNKTDAALNAVDIPHMGPEMYGNMWQKVRSMWSYVYDYYYDKYDWFHMGGDDMYVLVENLRLYLESEEIQVAANGGLHMPLGNETSQVPLYLGRRFAFDGKMSRIYNSGGPGYTLNKAALKVLATSDWGAAAERKTYAEDVFVASALKENGVLAYDTKDDTGAERYMHFPPGFHMNATLGVAYSWYEKDSIDLQLGMKHCSTKSVAFHYVSPELMRRMHAILNGMCDTKR